jgi:hypothetical protein
LIFSSRFSDPIAQDLGRKDGIVVSDYHSRRTLEMRLEAGQTGSLGGPDRKGILHDPVFGLHPAQLLAQLGDLVHRKTDRFGQDRDSGTAENFGKLRNRWCFQILLHT